VTATYNAYWKEERNWQFWNQPSEQILSLVKAIDTTRVKDVLDLGCGIGRHAVYLAEAGFDVTALDSSEEALNFLKKTVTEKRVKLKVVQADYCQDVFEADSFDLVIAYNVIYHGFKEDMKMAFNLIHKWLRTDGLLFFTCPSLRDAKYGTGEFLAPHTYRPLKSIHFGDVHFFADFNDISELLSGFKILSWPLDEHYWNNEGTRQFSSYWQITAKKQTTKKRLFTVNKSIY
jgi:tellurite methyltransferase